MEPDAAVLAQATEMPDDARLAPGLELYWRAFWELHGDRPRIVMPIPLPSGGFSLMDKAGQLPFLSIDRWGARHSVGGEEFDLLHALLRQMDEEWLEIQAQQIREQAT